MSKFFIHKMYKKNKPFRDGGLLWTYWKNSRWQRTCANPYEYCKDIETNMLRTVRGQVAQLSALTDTIMNVMLTAESFLTSSDINSTSERVQLHAVNWIITKLASRQAPGQRRDGMLPTDDGDEYETMLERSLERETSQIWTRAYSVPLLQPQISYEVARSWAQKR
jgi:hypothetical protein